MVMDRMKEDISRIKTRISRSATGAIFSRDRTHRYLLWRTWDGPGRLVLFVGLNPSVADERTDDPTIRRCIGFARREGGSGVMVANLFSYCATDPADLKKATSPVGRANDRWLLASKALANTTVVCWGNHGRHRQRSSEVLPRLGQVHCFGKTGLGEPKHPLYLRADASIDRL